MLTMTLSMSLLSFAADKKQLSDALAAVNVNLKTPEGKHYDEQIGKEFSPSFGPALKQCKQSAADGSTSPFDMFLKLDANGAVREGLAYPESAFAGCVRTAMLKGKFSPPPHGDYWVNIHFDLK
jgi:hypothetical protein